MNDHTQAPNRRHRRSGVETPLLWLLRCCTEEQRNWLAREADTTVDYLYAIAGCHRKKISVQLAFAIEKASTQLNTITGGDTPIVTAQQISTMCAVAHFDDPEV